MNLESKKGGFNPEFRFVLRVLRSKEKITHEDYKNMLLAHIKKRNITPEAFFSKLEKDGKVLMRYYLRKASCLAPQVALELVPSGLAVLLQNPALVPLGYAVYPPRIIKKYLETGQIKILDDQKKSVWGRIVSTSANIAKFSPTREVTPILVHAIRLHQFFKMNEDVKEELVRPKS